MIVGTHDGRFHADEVVAVCLLRWLFGEFKLVRTRSAARLTECDIVVDVGGEFDAERQRFDHHMASFREHFSAAHTLTRLSSAGLVWKFYGERILLERFSAPRESVAELHALLYELLFEAVDYYDNGELTCDCFVPLDQLLVLNLSHAIGMQSASKDISVEFFMNTLVPIADTYLRPLVADLAERHAQYRAAAAALYAARTELAPGAAVVDFSGAALPFCYFRSYVKDADVLGYLFREADLLPGAGAQLRFAPFSVLDYKRLPAALQDLALVSEDRGELLRQLRAAFGAAAAA